jgi:hypothetical protein
MFLNAIDLVSKIKLKEKKHLLSILNLIEGVLLMAVVIKINESSPTFAGLDPKHIALVVGAVSQPPMFYNFVRSSSGVGNVGTNNKILSVSKSFPLVFDNDDFTLLGSEDPYHASRTLSLLIDFMRKNLVIVEKDGVPQTPEQILAFTP